MTAQWYVINVHSGFEDKIVQQIWEQAEKRNLSSRFEDILVPTRDVVKIKKGKKISEKQNFFPGYLFVKVDLNDETWHFVKSIPKVSALLGRGGKPLPISRQEFDNILFKVSKVEEQLTSCLDFEVGERVRVNDGPFNSLNGIVEDVDPDKSRLKVAVSIFGRSTPVDLDFSQVEKLT